MYTLYFSKFFNVPIKAYESQSDPILAFRKFGINNIEVIKTDKEK